MSRSRKKVPCCHIVKADGSWKKIYNRRLRRKHDLDIPSGNFYRKMNESYNIRDWDSIYVSFEKYSWISAPWMDPHAFFRSRNYYERHYLRK